MTLRWHTVVCLFVAGCAASAAEEKTVDDGHALIRLHIGNGQGPIYTTVRSWKSFKEDRVVMQSSDYSCGAAAVATLLTYTFDDHVPESAITDGIFGPLSPTEKKDRQENGFSLLDLSNYLTSRGYETQGFRLTFAGLQRIHLPALVHLSIEGYKHFVILNEIRGDRVYFADPSRGNVRMSVEAFAKEWTRIALVVTKPGDSRAAIPDDPDREAVLDQMLSAYRAIVRR